MQNRASNEPPRVLLTGAGAIGRRHAQNLRDLEPGAEIAVVCHSPESRNWVADFGATPVDSVAAGLQRRPQVAVVCSVSAAHAHDLVSLMSEVEALYIEKPVVIDKISLQSIQTLLDSGWSRSTVVGCNLRYLGSIEKLKEAVDSGEAGRLAHASLRVGQWLPDWRSGRDYRDTYSAHRDQGGGVIFDLVHELDSACFLFGDIARGQAVAGRSGSLQIHADDSAIITLLMKSSLPVLVSLDYISRKPVREYRVTGDAGTLRLDVVARELAVENADGIRSLETTPADWEMAHTYRLAMQDLLQSWRTGSPTRYNLAQALHTTSWMIELEAAAWRANET